MRYHQRILFILCFFLGGSLHYAQNGSSIPNLTPPSPEASAFFKFTETPVTLSDGLANVNIPIYNIETKGISIPISLGYHSRGVKVGEIASRVGLGWTLNYGGMISRQKRGKADDSGDYGLLTQNFYSTFFDNESTRNSVYSTDQNYEIDFQPDLFFFSFPGHNGKFILDQVTKSAWQQKYSDIKIKYAMSSKIDSWTIVDEKGNTYYFASAPGITAPAYDSETITSYRMVSGNPDILGGSTDETYSSWHLVKIVTYEKEEITFEYDTENIQYIRKNYDVRDQSSNTDVVSYYSKVAAFQKQIKQINFPGGKVVFTKAGINDPRLDLQNGFALDKIAVYNINNVKIKEFDLDYSFVTSNNTGNYHSLLKSSDEYSHKRMYLSNVTEIGKPSYSLEYNVTKMPNRFSTSQDNWGFYNGANNGPYLTMFDYGSYSVDRRVDSIKSQAGMLEKMILPTGGSVDYIYEQNITTKPPHLDQLASPGNNPVVSKNAGLGHLMIDKWDGNKFSTTFTIGQNKVGSVESWVTFNYNNCQQFDATANCNFPMMLAGAGATYGLRFGTNSLSIPSGTYELQVYPPGNDSSLYFQVNISWEEEDPPKDPNGAELMTAAGKRIKRLEYSDGQQVVKTQEFKYTYPNGSNSGKIFGLPNFYSIMQETSAGDVLYPYGCRPGSPLTSLQGNELGYSYVTIFEGTKIDNVGKTEHQFTNFSDGGTYYEFPYHLPIDNQWIRGMPLMTKYYKRTVDDYKLIKKVANSYIYAGDETSINGPGALAFNSLLPLGETYTQQHKDENYFVMPLAIFTPDDDQPDGHAYKVYYQKGGTADLYETTETSYLENENGNQDIQTSKIYHYNYQKHYQVASTETSVDGKTIENQYKYSSDVTSTTSLGYDNLTTTEKSKVDLLSNANRIVPVQTETIIKEGTTIKAKLAQRTIFDNYNGTIPFVIPKVIETAKLGQSLKEKVIFHEYDSSGNPLEVSLKNGPHTVYIWGYNKQYVVAKIENATYSSIESLPFFGSEFSLGNGGLSSTQENALRGLSNALVTTYSYNPLVGIATATSPNGDTTNYSYDANSRLQFIRDEQNNTLSEYQYYFNN